MPQLKRTCMVLAGLLMLQQLPAQTPVTMSDAIQYALKNSEVLKQARLDIEKGVYQVKETRANALPQLSATSTLTNNLLVQQFVLPAEAFGGKPGEFMAIKAGQTWGAMTQVQLSQQIFNQQVMTGLKAARTTEDFYRVSEELARENVIQQVAVNYYQVQISRLQMSVVNANLERVTKLGDMIAGQYENGLAKKIDVDRVKVNRSNLEAQKLLLENSIAQQENLLKYYMGMPVMEQIALSEPDLGEARLPEAATAGDHLNIESLLTYSVLKKQEDLLKFQRDAIAAEAYPTLSLSGNYTYNTQSNRFNLYGNNALSYDMAAVTLNLRIPIFDGFSRKSRVRQSEIARLNLQEDIRKTSNSLYMANENAKSQLDNSLRTIRTQAANKELAGEVYESIRNNYRNGLANLTDLLNAEDELVNAQKSYNEALLQYRIAEVELLKSNGKITSMLNGSR
ncbi:MAG: transporter [Cytophagaceae bacterium SCN 52-12]|nr:MAG: transporter [Cytophagaceae bacterium SCN 52-12]